MDWNPANWNWGWPGQALHGATSESDATTNRRNQLDNQGLAAGRFAGYGQDQFKNLGGDINGQMDALKRLASGQDSYSAEQLRQGLQQNVAAQQSMAAGANPSNAAMAARNAMNNTARLGYGMSGQQALAGIQERQAAQQALANLTLGARGQDLQAATGSRANAINAYGTALGTPPQTLLSQYAPLIQAGSSIAGMAAMSDRRLKKNVKRGDGDADAAIKGLKAYAFDYKDAKYGKGKQVGVMAQDLETAGLGHAVVDTPAGKAVDGAKAATSSLALVARLGERVARLEGKKGTRK